MLCILTSIYTVIFLCLAEGPSASDKKNGPLGNTDFSVEYSKSSRASCRTCGEKIEKVS